MIPREHPATCSFLIGEPSLSGGPKILSEVCIKQSPVGKPLSRRFLNIPKRGSRCSAWRCNTMHWSFAANAAHGARRSYYQSRASRTEALPVPQRTDIHSNLGTLVMYELHGCLSQGVSVCRLSDHPLAFDAGLMEHSRRGAVLLRVRMTARVAIRWGVHRLYEIAITTLTSWTLRCGSELLRALKIIYGGECRTSRGVSVGRTEVIQSWSARQSEVCMKSSCSKIEESRGCHACYR